MRMRTAEIAAATGGRLVGPDVEVDGVGIDSREVTPGSLFVPVMGERDGHDFVADAVRAGAAAYLSGRPVAGGGPERAATAIVVDDTLEALAEIGRSARDRLGSSGPIIGITGSVGKTTTKDLLASVLATTMPTMASPRSFNNELGVPLTLANAPDGTHAVVVEMGARGAGHIAELCTIARPDMGIVTTVESVHTEHFGGLESVAAAKSELIHAVPPTGLVVLNVDNQLVAEMAAVARGRVVRVSRAGDAPGDVDVWASDVLLDDELRAAFDLRAPEGSVRVHLSVRGEHNVMNALLAAAAGLGAGVPLDAVAEGLATAATSPWRMELLTAPSGLRVLNDAYNAGPASMGAALRALAALDAGRRVAVLGVMAELGDGGPAAHREAAGLARDLGVDVVAVAAPEYGPSVTHVDDLDAAVAALEQLGPLGAGDAVLVKASRVAGLERLAARLVAQPGDIGGG
jgi:UDP-N-acetylmuramoyl-tripeptide--D-alanyl-D-alanine ligase